MQEEIINGFHNEPPGSDASPEIWAAWMEKEKRSESAAKAKVTKSLEHGTLSDLAHFIPGGNIAGSGGVIRQQEVAFGFSGDFEGGDGTLELIVNASQDRHFQQRGKRGKRKAGPLARTTRKQRRKADKRERLLGR